MRMSKAEIKMETLKLRMYSREVRDRMQLIRQCQVVTTHEYVVSGDSRRMTWKGGYFGRVCLESGERG
jgi:hypothetical protein